MNIQNIITGIISIDWKSLMFFQDDNFKSLNDIDKENIDSKAELIFTKGKHKYIYPLNKKLRKACTELHKPYPKKDNFTANIAV